jgi:hypothetical protein
MIALKGSIMRKFALLGIMYALFFSSLLFAKRMEIGMVNEIRRAEIIVFADIEQRSLQTMPDNKMAGESESSFKIILDFGQLIIKPIEVLKGDPSLIGKEIAIPYVIEEDGLTPGKKVVLLYRNSENKLQPLRDYPETSIPKLRCLTGILKETQEPKQIRQLVQLLQNPAGICPEVDWTTEVFDPKDDVLMSIYAIRNPDSFEVLAQEFDGFESKTQRGVLEWMAGTGDRRAVSILLRSLDSRDIGVRETAAHNLRWNYPGAPGVTEAFQQRWQTGDPKVQYDAIEYLIQRESSPELEKAHENLHPQNFFTKAEKAFKKGPAALAKKYCIQIAKDNSLEDFARRYHGTCVATVLSRDEQSRYVPAFAPFLERMAEKGNWLEAQDAVRIASSVKHPATLNTLIAWLNRDQDPVSGEEEGFQVVMALNAIGNEAHEKGAKALIARVSKMVQKGLWSMDEFWPAAALVWLGNEQDFGQVRQLMGQYQAPEEYKRLVAALRPVSQIHDEGAFWIEMIGKRSSYPFNSPDWFVMRLGHLREQRAIPALVKLLEEKKRPMEKIIYHALAQMGKPGIAQLKSLIGNADLSHYGPVFDDLCSIQKSNIMPFFRQLAKERTADLPASFWNCFQYYGTANDIALLSSIDDYWKYGMRYWGSALAEMREKNGYDLNGPIKRTSR